MKATAGAQTIVALVNGVEVGTPFTWATGHTYTLRLRTHCAEMQRVLGSYQALVNGRLQSFGGGLVTAPLQVVLEIQDLGLASSTLATVLYSGGIASSPAQCTFALVNSVDLLVSAAGCSLKQGGSAWVVSTLANGQMLTRREGSVDTGADFALSGTDLHFWPGRVPASGEMLAVSYRRGGRSFRAGAECSSYCEWRSCWVCRAGRNGRERSRHRCRAALRIAWLQGRRCLGFGGSASTGIAGTCTLVNAHQTADVQPGDQVLLPGGAASGGVQVPVERVTLTDGHATPEVVTFEVLFAQRRSNGLSFATSGTLADDVALPVAVSPVGAVASLAGAQVVSATATALQIDAGVTAPNGGGFEVRRRDGGFRHGSW